MRASYIGTNCACLQAQLDIGNGIRLQSKTDIATPSMTKNSILKLKEGHPLGSRAVRDLVWVE